VHHLIMWRRTVATLLLASYTITLSGCTSWKNQGTDVAAVITPSPLPAAPHGSGDAPSSGYPGLRTGPVYAPTVDTVRKVRITTKSQGLGIGLTIAQRIVEAHAGTIAGQGNHNGGATFTVTLPRSERVI